MSVALHHEITGPSQAPVLLLGGSLGTSLRMWDPQIRRLSRRWRVVTFDLRGHGRSPTADVPVLVSDLADDVEALADSLRVRSFGYCGLSLGGAIGQMLAANRPERVRALVLCCTSARFGDPAGWRERARRVRQNGTGWLTEPTRQRWFTPGFLRRERATADRLVAMVRATSIEGYAACCDALAEFDSRPVLHTIRSPTLVIAGADDRATPVAMAQELTAGITAAELAVVPDAAHLATVERSDRVTDMIAAHLERHLR
jgi:3-oxoadipate enol-lactonase